jgi:pyrimidine-specific ribonucleoside hydrolase
MKKVLLILHMAILALTLSAHPWKPLHYVIVDTDCGLDDFRAICMLLASSDVRVLAITVSNGVLDARTGFYKVKSLLRDLHHEGILTGININRGAETESCLPALQMEWGSSWPPESEIPDVVAIVQHVLDNCSERIAFLSLGSLNTAQRCMKECPAFPGRLSCIMWSSTPDYGAKNFNYALDEKAASGIFKENLPLVLVNHGSFVRYSDSLINQITEIPAACADKFVKSLTFTDNPYTRSVSDESAVLLLHYPALFNKDSINRNTVYCQIKPSITYNEISASFKKILTGETVNQNQVLSMFPMDSSFYYADVQNTMSITLSRYGKEEWTASVMANELHRHLGVYAVIGVKMGMRAKEYFGAGIDEMRVVSFAGLIPPLSCMNDGLQVSTGATLGHGLITIAQDTLAVPQADFYYLNQGIRLILKPEYSMKVNSEIRELNRIHGLDSNIYWELVRKAAIKYWTDFNREDIFIIQVL